MKRDAYVLYLDRYHQGDPLFVKELARVLAEDAPPCLLVHGSGEKVERTLESQGLFPERRAGVLQVETPEQVRLVERAAREANQALVGTLTDALVAAVGVQGIDRRLLHFAGDGTLTTGRFGWVQDLVKLNVVPVLSTLARGPGETVREVAPGEALVAVARALDAFAATIVFFTKTGRAGLARKGEVQPEWRLEVAPADEQPAPAGLAALGEPKVARHVAAADLPVLVTSIEGLRREKRPSGTYLRA